MVIEYLKKNRFENYCIISKGKDRLVFGDAIDGDVGNVTLVGMFGIPALCFLTILL
jgi:hypothetical protein